MGNTRSQPRTLKPQQQARPFVPPITQGLVIKVYDGDTITITSKLPYAESELYKFRIRLARIDTPEIKGQTEHERTKALEAKSYLEDLILNKLVSLRNVKTDKYGRILCDVYVDERCVNDLMLQSHHAISYDGGKKQEFVDESETTTPANPPVL